ncbi:integrin alpha N-terminal domain-containing protein [Penicillium waksmanii]|uniref:integrin alpha N-terminal domain-containing protein n=1 Tax=Penicillium waksmanii TaxID=69791 RepID=UPI0025473AEB|nr:integrin alpha N-terminal domain-containing protein [Penicillium waksmanii]KAJ5987704.1 integrin alpha N-terminal domain-containing protein [Penicillium waksmanii]
MHDLRGFSGAGNIPSGGQAFSECLAWRWIGELSATGLIPVGTIPFGVAVGDFNEDDYLDIVTADVGDNTVSILLGDGLGSFQPQATFPVGTSSYSVAVGDFNGDDYLDIVTANLNDNTVSVLLGKPCDP